MNPKKFLNVLTLAGFAGTAIYHHKEFLRSTIGRRRTSHAVQIGQVTIPTEEIDEAKNKKKYIEGRTVTLKGIAIPDLQATFYPRSSKQKIKGLPQGEGILEYEDGRVMIGNFENGKLVGKGYSKSPSEGIYYGNFVDGKLDGAGYHKNKDGIIYEGTMEDGQPHGTGKLSFPQGSYCYVTKEREGWKGNCYTEDKYLFYEGQLNGKEPHGKGRMKDLETGEICEGEFVNGIMQGRGKLLDKYGDVVYEGEFKDNMPTSQILKYREGLIYFSLTFLYLFLSKRLI